MITRIAFNKIIDIVGVWGGWGPTITVAWGLNRPKSGPAYMICTITPITSRRERMCNFTDIFTQYQ